MHQRYLIALGVIAALAVPASRASSFASRVEPSQPAVWRIDPAHSEVSFRIRHFVTRVRGKFTDFRGTITADPQAWGNAAIDVEIRTASITTDNAKRDAHLRSSDFFAADSFPTITFKSTRIERNGDDARIFGMLTMRGITHPVVLEGHFNGVSREPDGQRAGFEATAKIDRTAYGVTWNRAMEGGGAMLGDDVEVDISVEAVRASP